MTLERASHQKPGQPGRIAEGGGEARAVAVRDEARSAGRREEGLGRDGLLLQALSRENMVEAWKRVKANDSHDLNFSNRPVRTRMPGGVAGARLTAAPYADQKASSRVPRPFIAQGFESPPTWPMDGRLLSGALVFGAGWGLGGFCPGPALTALGFLNPKVAVFVAAMASGMILHDGLWFQAIEAPFGMKTAKGINDACMGVFSPYEAFRIKRRLGLSQEPGLEGLKQALGHRLYSSINRFSVEQADGAIVYRVMTCRVQEARRRKGLEDYPCKSAGLAEYPTFASMIDKRIKTSCVACPPDPHPEGFWCAWCFELKP